MFIVPITKMPSVSSLGELQRAEPPKPTGLPFQDILSQALDNVRETSAVAEQDAYNLAMGNMDDLHTMQINAAKAATAMEFTVELTTRAVNAYNEVMRMQI
ncbi:MAG: flagellar hook-basal body complex protein FliE [Angelakisella sp.]